MFKGIKHNKNHLEVRFEGLPDTDEEEQTNLSRERLAKDAKLGAEIENEWKIKLTEMNWEPVEVTLENKEKKEKESARADY